MRLILQTLMIQIWMNRLQLKKKWVTTTLCMMLSPVLIATLPDDPTTADCWWSTEHEGAYNVLCQC